jgi:general stress protein YciG
MPNRPGNDDRNAAEGGLGERGGQRDASSDMNRQSASSNGTGAARTRSNRGFASMDREKQKEIASKGGRAAHAKGTAHEFDSSEAREAGRKGGVAVSRNREHMAAIGRRGGEARGSSRARAQVQTNSGGEGTSDNSFQNSRNNNSDRQVAINNESDGVNANSQGARGGNSSLGGERRPNVDNAANSQRGETFGNP